MHLVQDKDRYLKAKKKGLPFFYTACDSAEPIAEMTTEVRAVTCPGCRSVAPEPEPLPVPVPDVEQDFDDLDADLDAMDMGEDPEPSEEEEADESPLGAMGPMLEMVLAGFDPDYSDLDRWAMDPADDEVLGSGSVDVRSKLQPDELEFVGKLVGISKMAGIEGLATRVVAILHRVLDEEPEADSGE